MVAIAAAEVVLERVDDVLRKRRGVRARRRNLVRAPRVRCVSGRCDTYEVGSE